MRQLDLVIENARIVTPDGIVTGSIQVNKGQIVGINKAGNEGNGAEVDRLIDAEHRYVIPGLVDPHTHLGAKYLLEQDFRTETPGAAAGGVTTIGIMHGSGRATRHFCPSSSCQ